MSDRGSVAPLVAGYLALILLAAFGALAVGAGIIAGHRIQGVADFAGSTHVIEQSLRAFLK